MCVDSFVGVVLFVLVAAAVCSRSGEFLEEGHGERECRVEVIGRVERSSR